MKIIIINSLNKLYIFTLKTSGFEIHLQLVMNYAFVQVVVAIILETAGFNCIV